ncbi:MAG: DUF1934 domain-containing protein [Ruminococcus sp.]|nr:DUF1934 domain-containing protein [Ruminococcus sp.]
MKKNVSIKLVSRQNDGEHSEQVELLTEGMFRFGKESYEISYRESEATGFEGAVTKLSVTGGDKVVMTRTAPADSSLIIELGKKHHCHYGTPFGSFMVGVSAKEISSQITEEGGRLGFSYVIDVNSSYVGDFEIDIAVTPKN